MVGTAALIRSRSNLSMERMCRRPGRKIRARRADRRRFGEGCRLDAVQRSAIDLPVAAEPGIKPLEAARRDDFVLPLRQWCRRLGVHSGGNSASRTHAAMRSAGNERRATRCRCGISGVHRAGRSARSAPATSRMRSVPPDAPTVQAGRSGCPARAISGVEGAQPRRTWSLREGGMTARTSSRDRLTESDSRYI